MEDPVSPVILISGSISRIKNAEKMLRLVTEFGLSSLGFKKEDFITANYITQIGYPPLRIDILNSIDGVEFKSALKNMKEIDLENGFKLNCIGAADFITTKQAIGRKRDLDDIKEIKKLPLLKKRRLKTRGNIFDSKQPIA